MTIKRLSRAKLFKPHSLVIWGVVISEISCGVGIRHYLVTTVLNADDMIYIKENLNRYVTIAQLFLILIADLVGELFTVSRA